MDGCLESAKSEKTKCDRCHRTTINRDSIDVSSLFIRLLSTCWLLLFSFRQRRVHCRRSTSHPCSQIQEQNTRTSPRQTGHNTRINDISPRIRQFLHCGNNYRYTRRDTPTHNFAFARGVNQSHAVQWSQEKVVPFAFAGLESEGSGHDEGTEFGLESLVSFHVSEPQARANVSADVRRGLVSRCKYDSSSSSSSSSREGSSM